MKGICLLFSQNSKSALMASEGFFNLKTKTFNANPETFEFPVASRYRIPKTVEIKFSDFNYEGRYYCAYNAKTNFIKDNRYRKGKRLSIYFDGFIIFPVE